jgi:hypothetical protein
MEGAHPIEGFLPRENVKKKNELPLGWETLKN